METILIGAIIVVGFIGLFVITRFMTAASYKITSDDIPRVIAQLKKTKEDHAWAQMMFTVSGEPDADVAIDYSVNNGELEFNWTLLGPRNICDKQKVIDLITAEGHHYTELKVNDCPLVRVVGAGVERLGNKILERIYCMRPEIDLIGEGFDWPVDGKRM